MIKIGLSKGRIEERFYKTLLEKELVNKIQTPGRLLIINYEYFYIYIMNSKDIFGYLDSGLIDIGIVGSDVIEEFSSNNYNELLDLNTGVCNFVLATKPNQKIEEISSIATKYPKIAKKYLEQMKLLCEIKKMNGSLELAPNAGSAEGIIDLVQTGESLKANGLIPRKTLERVSTRIISVKENEEVKKFIMKLDRK